MPELKDFQLPTHLVNLVLSHVFDFSVFSVISVAIAVEFGLNAVMFLCSLWYELR